MSWPSGVSVIWPAVAGTRLMQTRTFMGGLASAPHAGVLRVEERRRSGDGDRGRVRLAEIFDRQLGAGLRLLRRKEAHQDRLADRRARPGAGDIGPSPVPVDEPLALRGHDGLAAHHESLESRARGVVVDCQGAERDRRRLGALLEIGLLADEVLRFDLGPGETGLHQIELLLQLVAVGAVALLEPAGRPVDANADRRDPVRLARLPDRIPEPLPLFEWLVDVN